MKRSFKTILFVLTISTCLSVEYVSAQSYLRQPQVQPTLSYNSQALNFYTQKLKQTLFLLYNGYVDTVNLNEVTEKAVIKVMEELDPHSQYISAKDVKEMEEPLLGKFEGIGIEYAIIRDTLTVQSVIPGGPSEKVGLKAGDKLNEVDGKVVSGTGLTQTKVLKLLRGDKGTKVRIGVLRGGQKHEVVITRDKIPLNTVTSSYEIKPGIWYSRLSNFGAETYDELMNPIKNHNGVLKGLILDLRGNGGGYLHTALRIVNEFMERGQLILYSEGRAVKRTNDFADGSGTLKRMPVVVLIDENSASASEIVSGAIQDWDRGVIIGRRSFGKGLVQQEFALQDGSRLRLTVARYHTPSGRVIQSPYEMGKSDKYYENFVKRYSRGEIFNADSIKLNDSLKFKTLRLNRTVYGGGGIMPDIFIPVDTSYYSKGYLNAVNRGYMSDFVTIYSDRHRVEYESVYGSPTSDASFEKFCKDYVVTDEYFAEFLKYCEEKGVKFTEEDLAKSSTEIRKNLKGLIIRNIYGLDKYIRWANLYDKEVQRALSELHKTQWR